jgi:hypothetical protein
MCFLSALVSSFGQTTLVRHFGQKTWGRPLGSISVIIYIYSRRPIVQNSMAIPCGKIEIGLSLTHGQSCPSARPRPSPAVFALLAGEKASRNFFARFIHRNPLISLVSDERIQGNPSESNGHKLGFSRQNGQGQENPNGSILSATPPRRRAQARRWRRE